ncbi:Uncharacterised protein [Vibrio cholerae]|nr:Uncharacterised protein [Vibrio cholerae]
MKCGMAALGSCLIQKQAPNQHIRIFWCGMNPTSLYSMWSVGKIAKSCSV